MRFSLLRSSILSAVLLAAAACGGADSVTPPPPPPASGSIQLSTTQDSVVASATHSLTAHVLDAQGHPVTGQTITWTSANPSIATVSAVTPAGDSVLVHGIAQGTTTLTAASSGVQVSVAVVVGVRSATVALLPRAMTVAPATSFGVGSLVRDGAGSALAGRVVTYTSSDPTVARVTTAGQVTAVAAGTATITGTTEDGVTGTLAVHVANPIPSAFSIQVVYLGTTHPELDTLARQAAARWTRVIVGALPPATVTLAANQCGTGTPAGTQTVNGVLIYVTIDSVDGPGGGYASGVGCALRTGGSLTSTGAGFPAVGMVRIDPADLQNFTGLGRARDVAALTHEIGHVLGIGTDWVVDSKSTVIAPLGPGARFIGPNTRRAAYELGFTADSSQGVPVEVVNGFPGGHWDTSFMGPELMIPSAGLSLSAITVQSLADLGYVVDPTGADPYTVMDAAPPAGARFGAGVTANRLPPIIRDRPIDRPTRRTP